MAVQLNPGETAGNTAEPVVSRLLHLLEHCPDIGETAFLQQQYWESPYTPAWYRMQLIRRREELAGSFGGDTTGAVLLLLLFLYTVYFIAPLRRFFWKLPPPTLWCI